jgi:hypothetical protein
VRPGQDLRRSWPRRGPPGLGLYELRPADVMLEDVFIRLVTEEPPQAPVDAQEGEQ